MKLLLDTHTLIWWDNDELPSPVVKRIRGASRVFVSAATAWEIAIKAAVGKLDAPNDLIKVLDDYGFEELPVTIRHADNVRQLPRLHEDPFDRLLIAQALADDLVIVSANAVFRKYGVPVVWS